jgi:16S rRNA processing protein RimM
VYLEGQDEARRVIAAEWGGRIPSLTLEGLSTREDAEGLIGRYLEIDAQDLPGGTYYWHQIIGLVVHDERGQELGVVREVFRAGEAEVYRVEQTDGGELLIPGVRDVVRRIDLDAGLMVVHYESEEIR